MAFNFNLDGGQDPGAPGAETPGRDESVGIGDIGKAAVAGTLDMAAGVPASGQVAAERAGTYGAAKIMEGAAGILRSGSRAVRDSMSNAAKDAEENPTKHPVGWAGLQLGGAAPQIGMIMAFPESLLVQALAGGAMNAGQVANDVIAKTSDLKDDELAKQSPVFKDMLAEGMNPYMARVKLHQMQLDGADVLASVIAGAAGNVGLAHVIKGAGAAGKGLMKGAAIGAAEAAPGGALQGAQADYASQNADVQMGAKPEVDTGEVLAGGLKGAAAGALLGGIAGGVTGVSGRGPAQPSPAPRVEPAPAARPGAVAAPKPSEDAVVQAVTPAAAPAAPAAPGAKGAAVVAKAKGKGKKVEVTNGPNAAEQTALVANQPEAQAPSDPTTELLAKAQEINRAAAEQPAPPPPVVPEAVPPQVTPEIAAKAAALPRPDPSLAPEPGAGPRGQAWLEQQAAERVNPIEPEAAVMSPPPRVEPPAPALSPSAEPAPEVTPAPKAVLEQPREPGKGAVFRTDEAAQRARDEAFAAKEAELQTNAGPQQEKGKVAADTSDAELKADRKRFQRRAETYVAAHPDEASPYHAAVKLIEQRRELGRGQSGKAKALDVQINQLHKMEIEAIQRGDITPPEMDRGGNRKEATAPKPMSDRGKAVVEGRKRAAEAKAAEKEVATEAERQKAIDALVAAQKKDDESSQVAGAFGTKGLEVNAEARANKALEDGEDLHTALSETHDDGPRGVRADELAAETTLAKKGETRVEEETYQEPPTRERPKPVLKEGEGYQAITPKAPKAVEKRAAPERKKLSPAEVQAKIKERAAALRKEQEAKATQKVTEELSRDEVPGPADLPERVDTNAVTSALGDERETRRPVFSGRDGQRLAPIHSTRTDAAFDAIKPEGINRLLARKLREIVGDVPFHVLSERDMASLDGSEHGSRGMWARPAGKLDSEGHIVVRADQFSNPEQLAHTVMHEGAHAAMQRAMERDPQLMALTKDLMTEVHAAHGDVVLLEYAYDSPHEFIAEAFSNPEFQNLLQRTPVSSRLAAKLGLDSRKAGTLWDMVVNLVRKAARLPEGARSALEAAIRVGEDAARARKVSERDVVTSPGMVASHLIDRPVERLVAAAKDAADQPGAGVWLKNVRNKLSSFSDIAAYADRHFGVGKPIQKIADLVEMRRMKAQKLMRADEGLVTDLYKAERAHPKEWNGFAKLLVDATMFQVHPDRPLDQNTHLGKDDLRGMQAKGVYPELSAAYNALPRDLKDLYGRLRDYGVKRQADMKDALITNILHAAGHDDPALVARVKSTKNLSDADKALIGDTLLKHIKEAKELAKVEGPYFPLMRRGDFAVRGEMPVPKPTGTFKEVAPNEFQFTDRKDAIAYAQSVKEMHVDLDSHWVDAAGNRTTKDAHTTSGSPTQVFTAKVQNEHVEFVDSFKDARDRSNELKAAGLTVKEPVPREVSPGVVNPDLVSGQIKTLERSLAQRKSYQNMSAAQKATLEQALHEASLKVLAGTRVQSRRIQRLNVQGASHDWVRNFHEYSNSTAGYLAKLEYAPQIDAQVKAARDHAKGMQFEKGATERQQILQDVEDRVASQNVEQEGGAVSAGLRRLKSLSFLDKLVSPAFNIINSTQPVMITMPVLAGRHGVGRSFGAMTQAYRDIGAGGVVGAGLKDTANAVKTHHAPGSDHLTSIKGRLRNPQERAMLDYLAERGLIDPDAGMEIAKLIASREGAWGKIDGALTYAENIGRMLPTAVEAVNRSVTALSAYRLEREGGASHEQAMAYAQRVVTDTQGNYSFTNAPRIFNHPLMGTALQFKKFGQMTYSLIGRQIGQALKGATREERVQAWKTLAGLTATHVAMAGTLGLPTEPFKILLMAAQAAGLTSIGWDDVERWERQKAASLLGNTGGELATRGLSRLSGVDWSGRVGLDNLMTGLSPRSDKEADVKAYLFDLIGGAPTSLVVDMVKGANLAADGDIQGAAELMLPLKVVADGLKARRLYTEGKRSPDGRTTMEPYGVGEAIARTAGFTPRREAEKSAQRSAVGAITQQASQDRQALMSKWQKAAPGDKADAWKKIQAWNAGKDPDARITMAQLTAAQKRLQSAEARGQYVAGVRVNRSADEARRAASVYNVGP